MEEVGDGLREKAGFFARLEPRRERWALRRLRSAHVVKGGRKRRLEDLRGDGQALETIPILEYVWERTNRVLVKEELMQGCG